MTSYTALETLLAYAGVVLALIGWAVIGGALAGLFQRWLSRSTIAAPRTTVKDRRETLLKLISSTEREQRR